LRRLFSTPASIEDFLEDVVQVPGAAYVEKGEGECAKLDNGSNSIVTETVGLPELYLLALTT